MSDQNISVTAAGDRLIDRDVKSKPKPYTKIIFS